MGVTKNNSGTAYEARMLRVIKGVNSANSNPVDTTGANRKDASALAGYAVRLRAENEELRADRDRLLATHQAGEVLELEVADLRKQLATRGQDVDRLWGALNRLANEASGFVGMAERITHGNTNIAVMQMRITEARHILAPCLVCGECNGKGEVIGPYGESLVACPGCRPPA